MLEGTKSSPPSAEALVLNAKGKNGRAMVAVLKECSRSGDLETGKKLHLEAINSGLLSSSTYVANTLISMYWKCGSMIDAQEIFDTMTERDVVSWNCLLQGYAATEKTGLVLQLFDAMIEHCAPDARTYVTVLAACAATAPGKHQSDSGDRWFEKGKEIHSQAVKNRCCDSFVQSSLVNMYARFGRMVNARSVFDEMVKPDVVAWTSLLHGYVQNGESKVALELFDTMRKGERRCLPNARTYAVALTACATLADAEGEKLCWLEKGKAVHSEAVVRKCCHSFLSSVLINMYAKCGSMAEARKVFDSMEDQDLVSWTALLQGYVDNGDNLAAVEIFDRGGFVPDAKTFATVLTACVRLATTGEVFGSEEWLDRAASIHLAAAESGCCDMFVECALINLYGKCGSMAKAQQVFDGMIRRDAGSWNCLLQGYVQNGMSEFALRLFDGMQSFVAADSRTYVVLLSACASLAEEFEGDRRRWLIRVKLVHASSMVRRCCNDFVKNMLISSYSSCGDLLNARVLFDGMVKPDAVSWNALLKGYVDNDEAELALELFDCLKNGDYGFVPNELSFASGIAACMISLRNINQKNYWFRKGKLMHAFAVASHCYDAFVETKLVEFYAKCKSMQDARNVFENIIQPDVKAWNCLIQGYVENGENETAVKLIESMIQTGVAVPNAVTYSAALTACDNRLQIGKVFHAEIQRHGLEGNLSLAVSLMEFYAKCGNMHAVLSVFDQLSTAKDVGAWNVLISSQGGEFGDLLHVVQLFREIIDQGIRPNEITFTHVLTACSHAGLTDQGRRYFDLMQSRFCISPNIFHYTCLIDLLGRGDHIDEALRVVKDMPFKGDVVVWTSILGACYKWGNVTAGRVAYEALLAIDDRVVVPYNLMANIYQNKCGCGSLSKPFLKVPEMH